MIYYEVENRQLRPTISFQTSATTAVARAITSGSHEHHAHEDRGETPQLYSTSIEILCILNLIILF